MRLSLLRRREQPAVFRPGQGVVDPQSLPDSAKRFTREVERSSVLHSMRVRRRTRSSIFMATLLFGVVASIYTYTIKSVRQETFLDDREEMPPPPARETKS